MGLYLTLKISPSMEVSKSWDLIKHTESLADYDRIVAGIEKLQLRKEHPRYKVGQIIEFNGGYDNDIRMKSRITGFDDEGWNIYVLWDCYWYSIKDEERRNIKTIE